MYRVRPFEAGDILTLNLWSVVRGEGAPFSLDKLPPTGGVCLLGERPVSACFLFKTDGIVAYIDGAAGDPSCDKMERRASFIPLFEYLCQEGKKAGYQVIMAATAYPSLIAGCEAVGFTSSPGASCLARRI